MCNPRRVRVTVSRELAESWEQEIRRVVTRSGEAVGEARMREPLEASIGAPTLVMLERVLNTAEGWARDGDAYRYPLDGGYVLYHPDTRELEIVAQAVDTVTAEGVATAQAQGGIAEMQ